MSGRRLRSTVKRVAFPAICGLLRIHGKLRPRRVRVYYNWPDFARKAEAFADLLRRRGFPAQVCSGQSLPIRALLRSSPDLWIGFWNQLPVELLPKNYIFINAEPLNVHVVWHDMPKWFEAMRNAKAVWDYRRSHGEHAARLGVPFHFVPFGYAPYYEQVFRMHTEGKTLPQDIDVLFFGNLSDRRRKILDELAQHGMNVHIVSRDNPAHGEKLDELLARSKIVLGIHYFEDPQAHIADLARVDHLLSNRLFVIHERPSPSAADSAFESNVTTCEYRDILDTCTYFIAHPQERENKAIAAYEWFRREYALDAFIPYSEVQALLDE